MIDWNVFKVKYIKCHGVKKNLLKKVLRIAQVVPFRNWKGICPVPIAPMKNHLLVFGDPKLRTTVMMKIPGLLVKKPAIIIVSKYYLLNFHPEAKLLPN